MMRNGWFPAALLLLSSAACGGAPTTPTQWAALSSVEYVRVKPLRPTPASPDRPSGYISHPIPGDPYHRIDFNYVDLQAAGDNRFTAPFPSNVSVPVGDRFAIEIHDPAVVGDSTARDIYINHVLMEPTVYPTGLEVTCGTIAADGQTISVRCQL
jgi:hypothetical protein